MRIGLLVVLLMACSKTEAPAADAAPVASAAPEPPKKPPISTVIAKGLAHPARQLAMDATALYWTNIGKQDASGHHEAGMVMKMPKEGGEPQVLASALHNPDGLAVDGGRVYFTSRGTEKMYVLDNDGKVMSVAVTGGEVKTLVDKRKQPTEIAVRNGDVFVIERGSWTPVKGSPFAHKSNPDGSLFKLAGGKGAPVSLASNLTSPYGLALDGSNVYFALEEKEKGSKVMTAGPAKEHAKLDQRASHIASDGTSVFAVIRGGEGVEAKVMKLPSTTLASRPSDILAIYPVKNGPVLFTTRDGELIAIHGSEVKVVTNGLGEPRALVADEKEAFVGAGDKIYRVNLKDK